jgi:hypothetical protein
MEALSEAAEQRDWPALPAGVLQPIFCLASTWQTPGPCLAALVCRTWRAAAAGCSGICLLYAAGRDAADQSFSTWLGRSSGQLGALILVTTTTVTSTSKCGLIMTALAQAAEAAQAAGRPLRLHTLRVLGGDLHGRVEVPTIARLVVALPHLRFLQLGMRPATSSIGPTGTQQALQQLAPLQGATQLEELYLVGPCALQQDLGRLLPPSLKRLSWLPSPFVSTVGCDLSPLTQLTFLQLGFWGWKDIRSSSRLPPGLQQLEVADTCETNWVVLEEQREVVTAWDFQQVEEEGAWQLLPGLSNLRAITASAFDLEEQGLAAGAAFKQLTQLVSLTLSTDSWDDTERRAVQAAVASAASISSLRRLHLDSRDLPAPPALAAVTQLTQLRVSATWPPHINTEQQQAWADALGSMVGLRWLSVPGMLLAAGQAWLGGLQQLRVLVVKCRESHGQSQARSQLWREDDTWGALPPALQLLGVSGMSAQQAVDWQLRRRLQQWVGSSGCEVVVGVDLDEVCDPTQQLAGVPEALQQLLV